MTLLWLVVLAAAQPPRSEPPGAGLRLSLEEYCDLAETEGLRGLQTGLAFRSAGLSRSIVLRQTSMPSLTASYSAGLARTESAFASETRDHSAGLTLAEPLPTGTVFRANADYSRARTESGGFASISGLQPRWRLSAEQPLYLFAHNPVARSRFRAEFQFASDQEAYSNERLSIRFQAKGLYYDVLLKKAAIGVEERKVESSRKLLDVAAALVDAGKLAPVEKTRANLRVLKDQRQLEAARLGLRKAELAAKHFVRLPLDQPVEFADELAYRPFEVPLTRLVDYAYEHRPEVRRQRRELQLAELDHQESREAQRPSLSLSAAYGQARDFTPSTTKDWSVGGQASWLLFDSSVTRDRIVQSELRLRSSRLSLEEVERSTRLDVESAWHDVSSAERQLLDFQTSREEARANIELIRARFEAGADRLLDVFDAENEARNLENEYLSLLVNYNLAKDRLAQLVGVALEKLP